MQQSFEKPLKLVGDSDVADRLNIARTTIRVQRHLRRCGKPHWLNLSPVYVGNRPKYFEHEVDGLMQELLQAKLAKTESES